MRLPLIDGQGNFGSVDGDPPAAMRYTECRLDRSAMELLEDIDKDTVDFQANYDGNESEPVVLPARFPNLLVNGAGGIAVGMATNIPPHNLGEVIDAAVALIDNPGLSIEDLIAIVPGPDFPTGGIILGRAGIRAAYHTGRGSIVMRGKVEFETLRGDREAIIVSEIPYQVNKATMVERIGGIVAGQEDRRHRGAARRVRPRRLPRGDRDQARRDAGRGAQPALPLHAAAIELRCQHRGARRRASAGDEPEGPAHVLRRFPRRSHLAAHQVPAEQGARPRPHPGRAGDRGGQYRRGDPPHPRVQGCQRRARGPDGARLAGEGRRDHDHADRRSAAQGQQGSDLQALGRAGQGDPRSAPAAPHGARPRRDPGRSRQACPGDRRLSRHPPLARAHPVDRQGRACGGEEGIRHAAPHRHRRRAGRGGGRGPDPARGHGRHRLAHGLRQARAALGLSGAAARRQGPLRHADARRGFRVAAVRRLDPCASAVLLLARPRLQGEGLAPAAGRPAGARQGADQHSAARAGRNASPPSCRCRTTSRNGASST